MSFPHPHPQDPFLSHIMVTHCYKNANFSSVVLLLLFRNSQMDVIEIRSQKKVEIAPQLGLRPCVPNFSLKRILIFESLCAAENMRFEVEMLTDSLTIILQTM